MSQQIVAIFSTVSKQTENVAMTAADQLRLEGRIEATYKFVKGAFKLGMNARTIANTFELDVNEVEIIINVLRQEKS